MTITNASHLGDGALTAELTRLARSEREATVALIVHLAEFDARRLYRGAGFTSLFEYCVEVLRLSEDAACNRIASARAARRYPRVLGMLLLVGGGPPVAAALPAAPEAGPSAGVGLPSPPPCGSISPTAESVPSMPNTPATPRTATVTPRPHIVRPLSAERYEIRFTVGEGTRRKLQLAQELLSHAVPNGDLAELFDRALTLLVDDLCRKKFAATSRPRPGRGPSGDSRRVPASVMRTVWMRDRGSCAYVSVDGRRCGSRRFVEFHHLDPYAAGGKGTVDRMQLRCGVHNRYEAELFYGPARNHGGADVVREPVATWSLGAMPSAPGRISSGPRCELRSAPTRQAKADRVVRARS